MSTILYCFAALVLVHGAPLLELQRQQQFIDFVKAHSKNYDVDEFALRYNTFKANLVKIETHNAGSSGYKMGMNQFGDLSAEEFKEHYTQGFVGPSNSFARSQNLHAPRSEVLVDSVDWSAAGAVTPVKNQGQCGSCWAFSTTGAIEGIQQIVVGELLSLSEQQLVDCASSEGNNGCNGGLMDFGFEYAIKNGGLDSEGDYKYLAKQGPCDTAKEKKTNSKITAYKDVAEGSEDDLLNAVTSQPVSIAIEADQSGFQFYKSGVFDGTCGTKLDHGVLLVGFGTDDAEKKYWKVKNSWGESWGEEGYIRLVRGKNLCGIANRASYPVI